MRALLVWPKFGSFSFWNFEKVCELAGVKYMTPPLGLLTVAALLPKDWTLTVVDENVRMLTDADYAHGDLALERIKTVHRVRARHLTRLARARGLPVVVGGPDPTLTPQPYLEAGASYMCLDEGEVTLPMFLADLQRGVSQGIYRSKGQLADVTKTPVPRFDLVNLNDYLYVGLQFSRGCPYRCEFCNVVDLFDNKYRTKQVEQVIADLDFVYAQGYRGQIDFFDDNLAGDMKLAKVLLRAIADWLKAHDYPFHLSTSVTLNIAKDPELLDLFREARFKYFLVGIETPDTEALKQAHKPHNTGFSISEAVDAIYRRAGATVHSGFLLGLDGESANIGDQICDCIDATGIPWVMAGVVFPLPGTKLSQRLDREGRLFESARGDILKTARDQVSAGIQFRPERPSADILRDLVRVMHHAFDPERYFARCADVATRLRTVPNLMPSLRVFFRNVRTFLRLCVEMTRGKDTRRPFWKALWHVVRRNRVGLESLATLSVLYVHFRSMLPYAYEQLANQQAEIAALGEEAWLRKNLPPAPARDTQKHALPVAAQA